MRERREDIPALANFFLHRFSTETKKNFTEVEQEAMKTLLAYDWSGNVRELANVIERAVVLGQGPKIARSWRNPSYSDFSRSGRLSGWEEPNRSVWM